MEIEEYLSESERTERKFPSGRLIGGDLLSSIYLLLTMTHIQGLALNECKKAVIYDKAAEEANEAIKVLLDDTSPLDQAPLFNVVLDTDKAEAFHALIGMTTEMAEIIPILMDYIFEDEALDVTHLSEELADMDWYKAILLRKFGIDERQSRAANIAKLRVRCPEKFSAERALDRDLDAEREAMQ